MAAYGGRKKGARKKTPKPCPKPVEKKKKPASRKPAGKPLKKAAVSKTPARAKRASGRITRESKVQPKRRKTAAASRSKGGKGSKGQAPKAREKKAVAKRPTVAKRPVAKLPKPVKKGVNQGAKAPKTLEKTCKPAPKPKPKPAPKPAPKPVPKPLPKPVPKPLPKTAPKPPKPPSRTRAELRAERIALRKRLAILRRKSDRLRRKKPPVEGRRKLKSEINREVHALETEKLAERSRKEIVEKHDRRQDKIPAFLKKAIATGQIVLSDLRTKRIDTPDREGDVRVLHLNIELSYGNIEEAVYQIDRASAAMPGKYPLWLTRYTYAALGENFVGSGQTVLDVTDDPNDEDATEFRVSFESTGVWRMRETMMRKVRSDLEEMPELRRTVVVLVEARIQNFDVVTGRVKP